MKKYKICLYLFLSVSAVCLMTGYLVHANSEKARARQTPAETVAETRTETAAENRAAANQEQVLHETQAQEAYYLVAEDGFLLVFSKDRETVCLYTHMPVMDFPPEEQDRLREGIWFSSMMEIFQYLETHTS